MKKKDLIPILLILAAFLAYPTIDRKLVSNPSPPVVLRQGTSIAHGQSMRADSLFGTLELTGRARATLQP